MDAAAVAANALSLVVSPILARRFQQAYLIGAGLAISMSGLIVLTQTDTTSGPTTLATGFALIFLGAGPLVALSIHPVMASAPADKAGSAVALNETSGQFGFAFGLAALGSIGITISTTSSARRSNSGPRRRRRPADLADAVAAAPRLPITWRVRCSGREAFVGAAPGRISTVMLAVVAVMISLLRGVPTRRPAHRRPAQPGNASAGRGPPERVARAVQGSGLG